MTEAVESVEKSEELEGWTLTWTEWSDGDLSPAIAKRSHRGGLEYIINFTDEALEVEIEGEHYSGALCEVPWAVITRLRELYEQHLNG